MTMNDSSFDDLNQLREALDSRAIGSRELTQNYLTRIETQRDLNSFVLVCGDSALAEAEAADRRIAAGERLPLLGIPVAIKDVIMTKDIRTTCCSKILANFIPPYDATVVTRLKEAGAIVIGKTNMDEFAMGSSTENSCFGPSLNPWNRACVAGGSSGGSAVAVSAGLAPAALGTDTGGSIRQPAAFCSVVGLKPTYGRVSRYGVVAYASSLDQVGAFAHNVRDCAAITALLCGRDPLDSTSVDRPFPDPGTFLGQPVKGLRIGMPREYFVSGLNPQVEQAVKAALKVLEAQGAEIVEISLPHTDDALAVYYILAPAEASSNLARFDGVRYGHRAQNAKTLAELYRRSRSEGFGKEVQRRILIGTYVLSSGYYDAFYLQAQKARTLIAADFTQAFAKSCDLIAAPVTPTTAFAVGQEVEDPIEMYLNDIFTIPVNLAGLPGMSLPCGFDSAGMPIGLQLIGKAWDEETLLKTAYLFERATDWHKKNPSV